MATDESACETFRRELEELQRQWSDEDAGEKVSNRATTRLADLYVQVDADKRAVFDAVLADWVRSTDLCKQFDAKALIWQFRICSALPAVRQALAFWQARLAEYSDKRCGGEYEMLRSQALSAVHILEPVLRDLEARCTQAHV
jgi:hypothetical protein